VPGGAPIAEAARPVPLFVLGTARSGTTWLANLLVSHPRIVGLTAPDHHGIHESHLLDHTRYALPGRMTCGEFVSRYSAEDYYALAKVEAGELCAAAPERGDAITFFSALMDLIAARAGARYWLEKTPKHVIYFETLLGRFPTARFVLIERGFERTLASQLAMFGRTESGPARRLAEKVFRYESDRRSLHALARRAPERVIRVAYERLVADTPGESSRLLRWLGLDDEPLQSAFAPASSFAGGDRGPPPMALGLRVAAGLLRLAFDVVPLSLERRLRSRHDRRAATALPLFPRRAR